MNEFLKLNNKKSICGKVHSFDVVKYQPTEHEKWQNAYAGFLKAVN